MLGPTVCEPVTILALPVMLNKLLLYGGESWLFLSASIMRASAPRWTQKEKAGGIGLILSDLRPPMYIALNHTYLQRSYCLTAQFGRAAAPGCAAEEMTSISFHYETL